MSTLLAFYLGGAVCFFAVTALSFLVPGKPARKALGYYAAAALCWPVMLAVGGHHVYREFVEFRKEAARAP